MSRQHVMIIDDDDEFRELVALIVDASGYRTSEAIARSVVLAGSLLATLGLAGCMQTPADYSPNYNYMPVVSEKTGRVKQVLVPEACLAPSEEEDVDRDGKPRLAPGCANAYNLQRMAERKRDLVKGRPLGKAPGEVTANAVQRYMAKGASQPAQGGAREGEEPAISASATGTETVEQSGGDGSKPAR